MLHKLQNVLSKCDACIVYTPLEGEVDYRSSSFPLDMPPKSIVLPYSIDSGPFAWVDTCTTKLRGTNTYILIPGTHFDMRGTRHGKGGGWYDRFLSKVPSEWVRIGVAHASQISTAPLVRQSWDEPVDWLIASARESWQTYETGARAI